MTIHWENTDGVVTLTLDAPDRSANTIDAGLRADLAAAIDRLESERDTVRGVILASAKSTFVAGADIGELAALAEAPDLVPRGTALLDGFKAQLRRLERYDRPVVAAIGGSALGGGLELALACHHRIVLDDPKVRLGFPEVQLGLLPGGGGITRLVRMVGLERALPPLLTGDRLRPADALRAGLAGELAPDRDALHSAARRWIADHPDAAQPWDRPGFTVPGGPPYNADRAMVLAALPAMLHKRTRGVLPAPERILSVAVEGAGLDLDTALALETRSLVELAGGAVAHNMIGTLWYAMNAVNAGRSRPDHPKTTVHTVGVLGAGMMGAGIAHVSAVAGLDVVLKDVSAEAAEAGKRRGAAILDRRVAKGRLSQADRDAVLARVHPTATDADLSTCDLIIEAVFEDRALKDKVLSATAEAAPSALMSSNTSTLPITGLAASVPDPERFVGIHFFSPVHRMPLVEIIRGERTGPAAIATAFDYARRIGKTPIVVGDGRGFFTSRVFGAYTTEAIAMLAEGVPAPLIENLARSAGMAAAPLEVCDEVSLTLMWHVNRQAAADLAAAGDKPPEHPALPVIDRMVTDLKRPGRAGGAGFYDYPESAPKHLWSGLATLATGTASIPRADVTDRLMFIQAIETARCLDEGILSSADDANVGTILGLGFPPSTGGALRFIDTYGRADFVARADHLADRYGDRFAVPPSLREAAHTT